MNTTKCWSAPGDKTVLDYTSLRKLSIGMKSPLPIFRVLILGASSVGKTALIVRFATRRFIGDYDSTSERIYQCQRSLLDSQHVNFIVLDPISNEFKAENEFRDQILWADAYLLLYSVTDQSSLDEVDRMRFLINYTKRSRYREKNLFSSAGESVAFLVGNKDDVFGERMISYEMGLARSRELNCSAFFEISVRESVDAPAKIFRDLYETWNQTQQYYSLRPQVLAQDASSKLQLRSRLQNNRSISLQQSISPTSSGRSSSEGEISPRLKRKLLPHIRAKQFLIGLSQQNLEEYGDSNAELK
ncbi:ras-related protein Rap-2b-like [Paramacrobiotus metropolitanus]|uniref:ras-related protein Rap-2b-like n=1 Tax=Paramacrobiotus metropolitanus TaxID=2943436 RepID=UPI002445A680|nr:ras-related protein Rap-2b-like [Paramacrobiotus metropolitanus]XP_055330609.1 ras-related protein Rap-2b-like [Paramacrobiotus metropolitanus]